MNILIAGNAFPPTYMGGESIHLYDLATGLAGRGHRIFIIHPRPDKQEKVSVSLVRTNPRIDVYRISLPGGGESLDLLNEILLRILDRLHEDGDRIDMIHCHSTKFFQGLESFLSSRSIPLVTTVHAVHVAVVHEVIRKKGAGAGSHDLAFYREDIERQKKLCRISSRIIAISKSMASLVALHFDADLSRTRLVYNGIDYKRFAGFTDSGAMEKIRARLNLEGKIVVLFSGRVEPVKGIGPLVEACRVICGKHDNVAFLFLGNGSADQWLRSSLQGYRNVHFIDWLPSEETIPYYHLADIAVTPSLIEPFGLVTLEAMACRTCVIASDADGLGEIVSQDQNGWKIPLLIDADGDRRIRAEDITFALERAINDPDWRRKLAEGGLRRAAEFTTERMVLETEKVYLELLRQTASDLIDDRVAAKGPLDLHEEKPCIDR